jgi:hypothetical protein
MAVGASMKGKWMEKRQGRCSVLTQRGCCPAPLSPRSPQEGPVENSRVVLQLRVNLFHDSGVSVAPSKELPQRPHDQRYLYSTHWFGFLSYLYTRLLPAQAGLRCQNTTLRPEGNVRDATCEVANLARPLESKVHSRDHSAPLSFAETMPASKSSKAFVLQ